MIAYIMHWYLNQSCLVSSNLVKCSPAELTCLDRSSTELTC